MVPESGNLQNTASHEGSCDTESTKDSTVTDANTKTTTGVASEKNIEEIVCELVTMVIQNAVTELQNEV